MISICIIVKNEEKNIKECLKKLRETNYEIIVVDTGSTDHTKTEALNYTQKVYDFEWCGDFSAARNFAISKASHDYIMMIDSDEFLVSMNREILEKMISENPCEVGRIKRNNLYAREGMGFCSTEWINRIFSKKLYYYEGKIHEQVTEKNNKEYNTYEAPVVIDHSGYEGTKEERSRKAERNIELLKKVLCEDGNSPYMLYQLGKAYYYQGEFENAVEYFGKALEYDLNPRLEYVSDMVETYGYALIYAGQAEYALLMESIYEEFSYSADFVFMMGFVYMNNELFKKAVEQFTKAASYPAAKVQGVNSYLAYYNAGVIMECLNDKKKACDYYSQCGDYEPALKGKHRCSNSI